MSIKNKLGQLLMMDFRYWGENSKKKPIPFTHANRKVCELFKSYNLGGFILFKENIYDNHQTISLLRDLQANVATPLFFGIDQEGGIVNRLPQGTSGCGSMAITATNNPENAYTMSKLIGDELYSLGINTNFAPVIDVNSNKNNPIIGVRSYSDDPMVVTKYAKESLKGLADANVISCVKHFPGHGDTALDSHLSSITLNKTLDDLEKIELYPFRQLANQYSMVMTAHISMPKLDDTKHKSISTGKDSYIPATLSHKIITDLLKNAIGFKGLVISDAMDMKAIDTHFGRIEATKMAILAGIDIVLMPVRVWCEDDVYKIDELFDELEKEYLHNKNFAQAVDLAYSKVMQFKLDKKLLDSRLYKLLLEDQYTLSDDTVNSIKHQKLAFDIAKQSTRIVKNNGLIPFILSENQKIIIIDSDNDRLNNFSDILDTMIKSKKLDIEVTSQNIKDVSNSTLKFADLVILVSANIRQFNKLYSDVTAINPTKTINVAAITPHDIDYIDNIQNYVCIYGATSMDQTNYTKTSLSINIRAGLDNIFTS